MTKMSFLDIFSTTIINYTWKVIRLTCVIYNHELQSSQDHISSCALRNVDIYITWHILHVLCINKCIILWRVKYQMWRCQLRVLTSSVLIKLFICYLISLGLMPAYDILPHNGSHSFSLKRWFWASYRCLWRCLYKWILIYCYQFQSRYKDLYMCLD